MARLRARTGAGRVGAAVVFAALFAPTRAAFGHTMGVSRGDYTPDGSVVRAEIVLRASDAIAAVPGLDADGDGQATPEEVQRADEALEVAFFVALQVFADGAPCVAARGVASIDPPDGLRLQATYACPHAAARLRLHFGFLDRMPSSHRHLATVHGPHRDVDALAVPARADVDVEVATGRSRGFGSLLRGGLEHILTGADHLAFLLALVLGGTLVPSKHGPGQGVRARPLIAALTAFTIGHSLSLGIATLAGFAPGPKVIEPAVALSVAYVGAENLWARRPGRQWLLTLPFGLVHGFAFAGGLLSLGLPRADLPFALFAFNLGVEVGQLVVLGLLLPPLAWLARRAWYATTARAVSAAIVLAGLGWFFEYIA